MDGRAGNNVMKLVPQDGFPYIFQVIGSLSAASGQHAEPLGPHQSLFQLPVPFFVFRLRRIGAAVQFQIQLPVPGMDIFSVLFRLFYILMQFIKKCACRIIFYMRHSRNLFQRPAALKHVSRHAPAAVTVPIRHQDILAECFILKLLPASQHSLPLYVTVIGRAKGFGILPLPRRCQKIGKDFTAVDPPPEK